MFGVNKRGRCTSDLQEICGGYRDMQGSCTMGINDSSASEIDILCANFGFLLNNTYCCALFELNLMKEVETIEKHNIFQRL